MGADAAADDEVGGGAYGLAVQEVLEVIACRNVPGTPFGDEFAVVEVGCAAIGTVEREQGFVIGIIDVLRSILTGDGEDERGGAAGAGVGGLGADAVPIGLVGVVDGEDVIIELAVEASLRTTLTFWDPLSRLNMVCR